MTNQELLLSISEMMDIKLQPIQQQIISIEEHLNNKIDNLEKKTDTRFDALEKRMDARFDKLEKRVGKLEVRMDRLENQVNKLEKRVGKLEEHIEKLDSRMENLEIDVHHINLRLENIVEPRLQNIESCYISTYERYKSNTEKIDSMEIDISVMKSVIIQHGDTLQKIS